MRSRWREGEREGGRDGGDKVGRRSRIQLKGIVEGIRGDGGGREREEEGKFSFIK